MPSNDRGNSFQLTGLVRFLDLLKLGWKKFKNHSDSNPSYDFSLSTGDLSTNSFFK